MKGKRKKEQRRQQPFASSWIKMRLRRRLLPSLRRRTTRQPHSRSSCPAAALILSLVFVYFASLALSSLFSRQECPAHIFA